MDALSTVQIAGQGLSERQWASSPALAALASITPEELFQGAERLVVVAPHPDDEVLGCGGAMALARSSGMQVLVVSVTDGEAAYPSEPAWRPERLSQVRQRELVEALGRLDVAPASIVRMNVGDGRIGASVSQVADRLTDVLSPNDLVLVTYAHDGHPDHEACAQAAIQACAARSARLVQYPVWAWHWDGPAPSVFLRHAVRMPLPARILQAKCHAIEAFASQIGAVSPPVAGPILPDWALARFQRPFEVFIP
ncbi:PIG-L family deacetylase [Pseudoxanthomonas winnipegensis]|uniref:PIG-L deacetylase family protein n=1 Tax=Pseudoxanthomonas winnipegensis TaxID=2480810 RepID=UPI0030F4A0A5